MPTHDVRSTRRSSTPTLSTTANVSTTKSPSASAQKALLYAAFSFGTASPSCQQASLDPSVANAPPTRIQQSRARLLDGQQYVYTEPLEDGFALAVAGQPAPLVVSEHDFPGVRRVAQHLSDDLERVTGTAPELLDQLPDAGLAVIVGSIGESPLIDALIDGGKLDVSGVQGDWENFVIEVIDDPGNGLSQALVIAGSDKRGTIYGMFEVSQQMGVSPWYFWADAPVRESSDLYVQSGRHVSGDPAVKYRGIFINDEDPALNGWVDMTYQGFNSQFYQQVFELMLRLRANYFWPAQWGKAFAVDDPENAALADEYGIVIGTSHHEPMMRTQEEWRRFGTGDWDYTTNAEALEAFWREGIERMGDHESLVTIGMRGDGDTALGEETNIPLLEEVIAAQRAIIEDVTGKDAAQTPQIFAVYKEVQDYYEQGVQVPDDAIIVFADDNWGNIRKLPEQDAPQHPGGYGVYYHFDYVGGPRSYKWINTNPLPRVWEQMNLAYEYGADQLWLVNVGDLKPMELPMSFFLDMAWSPARWSAEAAHDYPAAWAREIFGPDHAEEIGDILRKYAKFNGRRKPELLNANTYSILDYLEAERIVSEYQQLAERAEDLHDALPERFESAFYQLVLYPVKASANLHHLYMTVAKNKLYEIQGRSLTNTLAERAEQLFEQDAELAWHYHHGIADGKWNHMMSQPKIGYTDWQSPAMDVMPRVERIELLSGPHMGVTTEGTRGYWPNSEHEPQIPELNPFMAIHERWLEVFNRGDSGFEFSVETGEDWLLAEPTHGDVEHEQRVWLRVEWDAVPEGRHEVPVLVSGAGTEVEMQIVVHKPTDVPSDFAGFVAGDGYVSIAADDYSRSVAHQGVAWQRVVDLGRTGSAMTPFPVTAASQVPSLDDDSSGDAGADAESNASGDDLPLSDAGLAEGGAALPEEKLSGTPRLEYDLHLFSSGTVQVVAYLSPSADFQEHGLRYAVSIDDEEPQVVALNQDQSDSEWQRIVADNINTQTTEHPIESAGRHVLRFWMVDPGVVLQKLVVDTGGLRPSYLGPPTQAFEAPVPGMLGPVGLGTRDGEDVADEQPAPDEETDDAPGNSDTEETDEPADEEVDEGAVPLNRQQQLGGGCGACTLARGPGGDTSYWWFGVLGIAAAARRRRAQRARY